MGVDGTDGASVSAAAAARPAVEGLDVNRARISALRDRKNRVRKSRRKRWKQKKGGNKEKDKKKRK